jgi:hypothetical protein
VSETPSSDQASSPSRHDRADDRSDAQLQAYLAEYQALRAEIEWLIRDGNQYQAFAIGLLAAALPFIGFVAERASGLVAATLLVVPFPFCLLGLLFFRQHEEVYVVAAYLAESLRPRIRRLVHTPDMWQWEEFKRDRTAIIYQRPFDRLSISKTILVLRALLFLLPSLGALVAGLMILVLPGPSHFPEEWSFRALLLFGLAFDAVIVILLAVFLWTHGDLGGRILPVSTVTPPAET